MQGYSFAKSQVEAWYFSILTVKYEVSSTPQSENGQVGQSSSKILEFVYQKLKEILTIQSDLEDPDEVKAKLEMQTLFLFSIFPSNISLSNSNFSTYQLPN